MGKFVKFPFFIETTNKKCFNIKRNEGMKMKRRYLIGLAGIAFTTVLTSCSLDSNNTNNNTTTTTTTNIVTTTEDVEPSTSAYTSALPTAPNAGTYYVWYYLASDSSDRGVKGDKNYEVTISKAAAPSASSIPSSQKPTAKAPTDLIYTGQPIALITAPSALPDNYEKIYYSIADTSWSDSIPTGVNVGTYTVKTKYVDTDGNYEDLFIEDITESIS